MLEDSVIYHQPPPPLGPLTTVFEDDAIIIVDKPAFLLSVPGRGPTKQDSVLYRLEQQNPAVRLLHRLDLDTSGLMVFAKEAAYQAELARHFQARRIYKAYSAVVEGWITEDAGRVELPIVADWERRPRQKICHDTGKYSLTEFKVLARTNERTTRVLLYPITGRSHQLRIHTQSIGHPILGCDLYAPPEVLAKSPRLLLHATSLGFHHPRTGLWCTFESPPPF